MVGCKKKEERDPPQDKEILRCVPDEIGGEIRPIFISDAYVTDMGLKNGPPIVDLVRHSSATVQ